jgi:hypothetical protein
MSFFDWVRRRIRVSALVVLLLRWCRLFGRNRRAPFAWKMTAKYGNFCENPTVREVGHDSAQLRAG